MTSDAGNHQHKVRGQSSRWQARDDDSFATRQEAYMICAIKLPSMAHQWRKHFAPMISNGCLSKLDFRIGSIVPLWRSLVLRGVSRVNRTFFDGISEAEAIPEVPRRWL